ncbi:1,6-anhydro-N-acetylmuramyl-L-alanine amidase AmpD [Enterovibrio sp. ZSDZ42]|uniref:1,6-anhydro-N-acetylmuramyl-L-alanine amidase AmpD n=1 Tax=Enterovibrio gelatinilyticus TaxID=2899819 RepID=A0ABT5QVD4_9GAMM|nr:1,6-anhydro-N-acetylmuramyl-L-alanine amidase AmpD [Enterovibrio sp. ZSDZ42]MDD1791976.1 1,6-anhydro-N-acetylmuramyl-L-alanine amidase AmpD [Enterovibrio sp. ZSDZ42]
MLTITRHLLDCASYLPSPHCNQRPDPNDVSLLVIHNISLPPGEFGGPYIEQFFQGKLISNAHSYFDEIREMTVSAHCLIKRDGAVVQFVPFDQRAWHAGVSSFEGREQCNDYSIGIELEGTDDLPYTDVQYQCLAEVSQSIQHHYPAITPSRITGHSDIAPGRKTDPGGSFNWMTFHAQIQSLMKG